jgi:hypothetical protein
MLEKINIHEEFDNYFVIVDFTEKNVLLLPSAEDVA